jgi:hypothetical protein
MIGNGRQQSVEILKIWVNLWTAVWICPTGRARAGLYFTSRAILTNSQYGGQ